MRQQTTGLGRLIYGLFFLLPAAANAEWGLNMTPGVTEVSQSVHSLHMTIFWICVAIAIVVFGAMFWSILHHRKSQGAEPAQFHESLTVEILWTIVPVLILIGMAIPATATLKKMYDFEKADLDIKITGYQWKWRYDYISEEIGFFSNLATPQDQIHNRQAKGEHYLLEVDQPLVIPVGKKVRFLVTANDVIHSWWVPQLAVKKDAIPGFINEAWTRVETPGTFRGQCAELCGKDHGFMPIVVKALPQEEYDAWVSERQVAAKAEYELRNKEWTLDELVTRGEKVYATNCAACHQGTGVGLPPAFPALKGSKITTEKDQLATHIDLVLHGKRGTAMPAFGGQLSEVDAAAVITYERNAWGNNTGEVVTPQQIVTAKQAQ